MSRSSLKPALIAAVCDTPNVETITIEVPIPSMADDPWIRSVVGRIGINGRGPTNVNPKARNKLPMVDANIGYFILLQT